MKIKRTLQTLLLLSGTLCLLTPATTLTTWADVATHTSAEIAKMEAEVDTADATALYQLGLALQNTPKKSCGWMQRAIDAGNFGQLYFNAAAHYSLGHCYESGEGAYQNYAKAVELYQQADELGSKDAQVRLALFYKHGLSIQKNEAKAKEYLVKSGYYSADEVAEFMVYDGTHCPANYVTGKVNPLLVESLIVRAETGNPEIQNNAGCLFFDGKWVTKDDKKSFYWMEKAAKNKWVMAQFSLGYYYEEGIGVEPDYYKAFEWYKKAAEVGEKNAQQKLSAFYFQGKGTSLDVIAGFYWLARVNHWL